ncbi:hypothetical protein M422DRAFT_778812 [Sphaerobolus stellatus SS14]|uniref:FAD-binding PCMH-type domain-containing protein n=1 Tax=Sphaerobolus stellatus (strain SS14) TaxID=990650 RepID=A0A0C9URV6_SPHS4|nr:hypothetical protein M422DRAFT_778812 [Sphaerobolus stellatus SS14]
MLRSLRIISPSGFNRTRPRLFSSLRSLTEQDVSHLASILPSTPIISTFSPFNNSKDELDSFNTDWMKKYHGNSTTVVKPRSTEEVSQIVHWCWENRVAIVPQGGNTGLVGGGVPLKDELVINLGNMNKIRSFDPVSGILVAESGCVLESLSEYLAPKGHIMPLDLGAKGSCQIGGNVSTNAGGLRLLRYGSLHGSVLGLEVVLPDGTILDQLSTVRKDNTGYDLKQLFIGAEGTLGIVTGVSILTPAAPKALNNVLLAVPNFSKIIPIFRTVRAHTSEILSAFEFFDRTAYEIVCRHGHRRPFQEDIGDAQCFILLETSGGRKEHDEEKLNDLLGTLMNSEENLITTGVLAQSPFQFASIWAMREGITEALTKEGKTYKYDISIPSGSFKDVIDEIREHLRAQGVYPEGGVKAVLGYGHFGDGNLHLNVVTDGYSPKIASAIEPRIYEIVSRYRGSISAEHGIGSHKTGVLHYSKGEVSRAWMKKIKDLFDERGIMNPGKVII